MKLNDNEIAKEYMDGYYVTTEGRVYSTKRDKWLSLHVPKRKYMGYPEFKLNGETTTRVHRCVAKLFLEPIEGKDQVNHIDGDKTNNCISNLEWVTQKENQEHAWIEGLHTMTQEHKDKLSVSNQGKGAKLTEQEVRLIFELFNSGSDQIPIAKQFNTSSKHISAILSGKYWAHLGLSKTREVTSGGSSKIVIEDATVIAINSDRLTGASYKALSKKFGISVHLIKRAITLGSI